MSRERRRWREVALHKCGAGSLLTESVVFGDPSSCRNEPDTWRASQQLPVEHGVSKCKLLHTAFVFVVPILLFLSLPSLIFLTSLWLPCVAIHVFDRKMQMLHTPPLTRVEIIIHWKEPVFETHESWVQSKLATDLPALWVLLYSTAKQIQLLTLINRISPIPLHRHLSDTSETSLES